jgi:hypothetical protein
MPSSSDLLMYRTYPTLVQHKQVKEIDFNYSPVSDSILSSSTPPVNMSELYNFEKKLDGLPSQNAEFDLPTPEQPELYQEPVEAILTPEGLDGILDDAHSVMDETINSDIAPVPRFTTRKTAALLQMIYKSQTTLRLNGVTLEHQGLQNGAIFATALSTGMSLLTDLIKAQIKNKDSSTNTAVRSFKKSYNKEGKFSKAVSTALQSFIGYNQDKDSGRTMKGIEDEQQIKYDKDLQQQEQQMKLQTDRIALMKAADIRKIEEDYEYEDYLKNHARYAGSDRSAPKVHSTGKYLSILGPQEESKYTINGVNDQDDEPQPGSINPVLSIEEAQEIVQDRLDSRHAKKNGPKVAKVFQKTAGTVRTMRKLIAKYGRQLDTLPASKYQSVRRDLLQQGSWLPPILR